VVHLPSEVPESWKTVQVVVVSSRVRHDRSPLQEPAADGNVWKQNPGMVSTNDRTLHPPLVLRLVPNCGLDILVVLRVLADLPFLVDIFEVAAKLRPCRVPLLEVEVHVQLFVEQLIYRAFAIDPSC